MTLLLLIVFSKIFVFEYMCIRTCVYDILLYAGPVYRVLALLIKRMLPVKCILLLSAYFLVAACYKCMRLTTSFHGSLCLFIDL